MNKVIFKSWNWELDFGEGELRLSDHIPAKFAIAMYDFWGRLYRVEDHEKTDEDVEYVFIYDYFLNATGQIIEKRALDNEGNINLIVRIEYDLDGSRIEESCWSPTDNSPPAICRPKIK